ncbi:hypothetical protein ACC754_44205, partial [Rhizobium johnstonii]
VDATQDALAAMQAGDLDVTLFQDAAGQGKGSLDSALKLAKGEKIEKKVYISLPAAFSAWMATIAISSLLEITASNSMP